MLMLTDNLEWWVRRFGRARDDRRPATPTPRSSSESATPRTGRFDREAAAARRAAGAHDAGHTASRR